MNHQLFGIPSSVETAALVVIPVPWDVTVSYGAGTSKGPQAVLDASVQVDLYDSDAPGGHEAGIAMLPISEPLKRLGERLRPKAMALQDAFHQNQAAATDDADGLDAVNDGCARMVDEVRQWAGDLLRQSKLPAVLGGDHSTALGLIQALAMRDGSFGILQIDAHCDLRQAYEGFHHSHASIMHNALELEAVERLVQVGIRDYCQEEWDSVKGSGGRVRLFEDRLLKRRLFAGETWRAIVEEIVDELPENVYVSFDIDGLDPALCPHTGTPVPGGLGFEEAMFLLDGVIASERRIVGFDLCEVASGTEPGDEWDANVGARVLYRLACAALRTAKL